MESKIKSGKHLSQHTQLTGSCFNDVCLSDAHFDDVSLANAQFHDVNMNKAMFSYVNFASVLVADSQFKSSTFIKCDLCDIQLIDCTITGMKINGIDVEEMIKAYNEKKNLV